MNIARTIQRLLFALFLLQTLVGATQALYPGGRTKNRGRGPVYTYVKTDKQGNVKWGVRHYVPRNP